LCDLLVRVKTVETRHQAVMQRGRNRHEPGAVENECVLGLVNDARLEHRLGKFLHEQRHTVRLRHDLGHQPLGQRFASGDPVDHGRDLDSPETVELHPGEISMPAEVVLEVRPRRHHGQYADFADLIDAALDELEGGRVDPVSVFEYPEHRPFAREASQLIHQGIEGTQTLLLRSQIECPVAPRAVDAEKRSDQCDFGRIPCGQQGFQPVQPRIGAISRRDLRSPGKLLNRWVERATDMIRGALMIEHQGRFGGKRILQRTQDARLANSRFTDEEDDLPLTGAGRAPSMPK